MTTTLTAPASNRSTNRLARFAPMLDRVADPLGYEAGDANLYRYVGNSPTNATDPTGLVKLKMSDLSSTLQGIAQSQAAKDEAANIAATINATWEMNRKWNWAAFSINNQKAKGFYCYEWAYAFQDAVELHSSGKYFTVKVEVFGDLNSGKVHAFATITSLETGKSVYVDDGFMGLGYIHTSKPIGGIYKTPIDLTAELERSNCDVPPVRTQEDYLRFLQQSTDAMDNMMH